MSACPEALALLNPMCCVVLGVPVTDSSWGYFLLLSTVWALWTNGAWLDWLEPYEWQWPIALWHGWQSEVRGADRWTAVYHSFGQARSSVEMWPMRPRCHHLQVWLFVIIRLRHHWKLQISSIYIKTIKNFSWYELNCVDHAMASSMKILWRV